MSNNDQIIFVHEMKAAAIRGRNIGLMMAESAGTLSTPESCELGRSMGKCLASCWTHIHNRRRAAFDKSYSKLTEFCMGAVADCEDATQDDQCSEGTYNDICKLLKLYRDKVDGAANALTNASLWK